MVLTRHVLLVVLFSLPLLANAAEKPTLEEIKLEHELRLGRLAAEWECKNLTPEQLQKKFEEQAAFFRQFREEKAKQQRKAFWGDQQRRRIQSNTQRS